ncbi:hypothetical protein [Haloferula sargassicola]|uniref:Uncharacterized protein n=1 Tax=Haloferula sargassicola TaxID=490096 RepID=A0ABP9UGR3_9BACT
MAETLANAWLVAVLAGVHISAGALTMRFIHLTTGGRWGDRLRPSLTALAATLPVFLALLVPLFFVLPVLFPEWAGAEPEPGSILAKKSAYLSITPFIIRESIVLLVIAALAIVTVRADRRGTATPRLGVIGLLTLTLAMFPFAVDWIMALEPHWISTAFPAILMVAQAVAGYSAALVLDAVHRDPPEKSVARPLSNLLLALIVFWSYVVFAQFLIIWSGDQPHEIEWYRLRSTPFWTGVVITLALCHLALPFFLLIFTPFKLRPRRVAVLAGVLLGCQLLYLVWLVAPGAVHASAAALLYPVGITLTLAGLGWKTTHV